MPKYDLNPQTGFVVSASLDFANYDATTFVKYYQPLLSPNSLGLFSALKGFLHPHPLISERTPLSQLLTTVNSGLPAVATTLQQLEAVGLIKTYRRHDELGVVLVFELQPTLTPAQFMKDDLLSVQLLQMVGPEMFKRLGEEAVANSLNVDHLENVSADFFATFHPDQSITKDDPAVATTRDQISKLTAYRVPKSQVADQNFDLHFVGQQLTSEGIDPQIVNDYRQLILVEHQTYGYDELEMARLLVRAYDVVKNEFDADQFKILARNANAQSQPTTTTASQPDATKQVTDMDLAGLPSEVQSLIKICEQTAPMAFLTQLKRQTNGYVSSGERVTVERLVQQSQLSNGAINLLLWYIIGDQGLATVKANLADAIANNWSRAGVQTAVDAYREIQRHLVKRNQSSQQRSYRRGGRKGTVKERVPEWAKQGYQPKAQAATAEQLAESKKLLAELHRNRQKRQQKK
ncbi:DnaD domain protein [Limosilactobacillus caecicola]|uniref:DnaD domain protein n=1 Tax=Limosilactobacillus caecicola TaxID=2941332 RepID=UPI00203C1C2E|nr:DnaD domain protein [Limosilactobacillus caecicola]